MAADIILSAQLAVTPGCRSGPLGYPSAFFCSLFSLLFSLISFTAVFISINLCYLIILERRNPRLLKRINLPIHMFAPSLVRATMMHQQRRPSVSSLPPSSALHTTIMASFTSQSQRGANRTSMSPQSTNRFLRTNVEFPGGRVTHNHAPAATAKIASTHFDVDPQMFIDSPFMGGAMLSPASSHESSARPGNHSRDNSFDLKFFNPSDDPRLLNM